MVQDQQSLFDLQGDDMVVPWDTTLVLTEVPQRDELCLPAIENPCEVSWQHKIRLEFLNGNRPLQADLINEDIDLSLDKALLRPISFDTAKSFIKTYEWLGTLGTSMFAYGLYFGHKLGGVVNFTKTTTWQAEISICGSEYKGKVLLLSRGASAYWTPPNTSSRLISLALKAVENDTKYRIVLAYSDRRAGEIGVVYQATNWHFIGWGATGTDYVPKSLLAGQDPIKFHTRGLPKELKSKRALAEAGHETVAIKRANKGRYVYFLGTKKERRELRNALRFHILPYPKREDFLSPKKLRMYDARMRGKYQG